MLVIILLFIIIHHVIFLKTDAAEGSLAYSQMNFVTSQVDNATQ